MLDESRIRMMTRMASYEENEGKKTIPIASYFRGDYISYNVIKSAIGATVACLVVFGMYVYYNMETFLTDIYKIDLIEVGRRLLTYYAVVIGVYSFIAYIIYSIRYDRAKKSLKNYYQALRKLSELYEDEEDD